LVHLFSISRLWDITFLGSVRTAPPARFAAFV
jgi:hypothetical protein